VSLQGAVHKWDVQVGNGKQTSLKAAFELSSDNDEDMPWQTFPKMGCGNGKSSWDAGE